MVPWNKTTSRAASKVSVLDFIEVSVSSPLNTVSQFGKALITRQYKLPLSMYSEVIRGILHDPGAGIVRCKGSPLVKALLYKTLTYRRNQNSRGGMGAQPSSNEVRCQ